MDGQDSKGKHKLTLSLNKEVVERAKAAGINISEITEKLLTAVTLTPSGNSFEDVAEAYGGFLQSIKGILGKYHTEVLVEKVEYPAEVKADNPDWKDFDIILDKHGLWKKSYDDEKEEVNYELIDDIGIAINFLGDPVKLLENVINSLIEAALRNKEQIAKLQFALKLVKALSEEEKGDNKA
jgi:hypothetical protein